MSDPKKIALLILGKKAPSSKSEDGAEPEMGAEGARTAMQELAAAMKAEDWSAAWEAFTAAHEIACGEEPAEPSEEE